MSGIVGIFNSDRSEVATCDLQVLTELMAFRGPDLQQTWSEGHVGFGHAQLSTTPESQHEQQPCSLNGHVWITADARIDGRNQLVTDLTSRGREIPGQVTDVDLILHAYHVWGESCVEHLIGDFAFAIWDGPNQKLFCARDHFGVKPFYFSDQSSSLIFSNTLRCLRSCDRVSDRLNDRAIGDFLAFGYSIDATDTGFAEIKQLPAAHVLIHTEQGTTIRQYWALEIDQDVTFVDPQEYVDGFMEVMRTAITDRLRTDSVGVMMTGGLDSTSIAAIAKDVLSGSRDPDPVQAYTLVFESLEKDEEGQFATEAADKLGIPIHYFRPAEFTRHHRYHEHELQGVVPVNDSCLAVRRDCLRAMARQSRVAMTGWDGDTLLRERPQIYFRSLRQQRKYLTFIAEWLNYFRQLGQFPRLGARTAVKRFFRLTDRYDGLMDRREKQGWEDWIKPEFEERLQLKERYRTYYRSWDEVELHPRRPTAFLGIGAGNSIWAALFESYDPTETGLPLEVRHPLADLRVVNFLLSIPPIPWCIEKTIVRRAMRGILPESIVTRPKSLMLGDLERSLIAERENPCQTGELSPELEEYVDISRLRPHSWGETEDSFAVNSRPRALNYWLKACRKYQEQ